MCLDSVDVGTVYDHNQAKHNDYDDDNDDPCQRDSVVGKKCWRKSFPSGTEHKFSLMMIIRDDPSGTEQWIYFVN